MCINHQLQAIRPRLEECNLGLPQDFGRRVFRTTHAGAKAGVNNDTVAVHVVRLVETRRNHSADRQQLLFVEFRMATPAKHVIGKSRRFAVQQVLETPGEFNHHAIADIVSQSGDGRIKPVQLN